MQLKKPITRVTADQKGERQQNQQQLRESKEQVLDAWNGHDQITKRCHCETAGGLHQRLTCAAFVPDHGDTFDSHGHDDHGEECHGQPALESQGVRDYAQEGHKEHDKNQDGREAWHQ